jgi:iron complex transport system permease protein
MRVIAQVRFATPVDARTTIVTVVLVVLTVWLFCWSLAVGDFPIAFSKVVRALFGDSDASTWFIIGRLRLPRALVAIMVGGAFGLSGAILQAIAGNPLATPDVVGVTGGASLAAIAVIVLSGGDFLASAGGYGIPLAALGGGIGAAALVYVLAWRRGLAGYRLVLVGVGIAAASTAGIQYLMTQATIREASQATLWLTGSLNGRSWSHVRPVAVGLIALVPVALATAGRLRVLEMGDDMARGLGLPVERTRLVLLGCAVGLASLATASAGPIAFVAFVAPVIARRLMGRGHLALLQSMLCGAALTLGSDLIARRLFAPSELPVGLITAVVGGPYLLFMLWRSGHHPRRRRIAS